MATIDETIYLARPDVLELKQDGVVFEELHETLFQEAAGAKSITILGGYMSPGYVCSLCSRVPRRANGGRGGYPVADCHRARAIASPSAAVGRAPEA